MTQHKVEALAVIQRRDGGDHEYWRNWYGRDYRDGLNACHTRAANLSAKYPKTLFRVAEKTSTYGAGTIHTYYRNGAMTENNISYPLSLVTLQRITKYDESLEEHGTALVESFDEYFDWLKRNEKCRYMVATCDGITRVFTAMENRSHGTETTMASVEAFLSSIQAQNNRKLDAIVQSGSYLISRGVLSIEQRDALCAMTNAEEWRAWIHKVADTMDIMIEKSEKPAAEKNALNVLVRGLRHA